MSPLIAAARILFAAACLMDGASRLVAGALPHETRVEERGDEVEWCVWLRVGGVVWRCVWENEKRSR